MSDFRGDVKQVLAEASQGNWNALEKVLHDTDAERAARLAAASLLAQAREPGNRILLAATVLGDDQTKLTALRAYLRVQMTLDETLVLEATHSKSKIIRRGILGLLRHLPYPVSTDFLLRCYLPDPYYKVPDPDKELASWLRRYHSLWEPIMDAFLLSHYLPSFPPLIEAMTDPPSASWMIYVMGKFGTAALPALAEFLPTSRGVQRAGIIATLKKIGGAEADALLSNCGSKGNKDDLDTYFNPSCDLGRCMGVWIRQGRLG